MRPVHHKGFLLFLTALLVTISVSLLLYNADLNQKLSDIIQRDLGEIVEHQRFNFNEEIGAEVTNLKSLAVTFSCLPDNTTLVQNILRQVRKETRFDAMHILNMRGTGISDTGAVVDLSEDLSFSHARRGETVLHAQQVGSEQMLVMATPIHQRTSIVGVLYCAYNLDRLSDLLLPSFGGEGYSLVVSDLGEVIASTAASPPLSIGANLFNSLEQLDFYAPSSFRNMRQDFDSNTSGHAHYEIASGRHHAQYRPLDINGWYIFCAVPNEVIAAEAAAITRHAILLAVTIMLIFSAFLVYIVLLQKKSNRERQRHTVELERAAYYDELTGLPNYARFRMNAQKILEDNPQAHFFVSKFDVINFKMINEVFDFGTGDRIICQIADMIYRLRNIGRDPRCAFARIYGDEFLLLEPVLSYGENERNRLAFEQSFRAALAPLLGTHSIEFRYGRYLLPQGETDIQNVLECVNLVHRLAKSEKGPAVCDYDDTIRARFMREAELEGAMEGALLHEEFKVFLQPKYQLDGETVVGAEALVRWQQADGSIVTPDAFIPLFERNGFIRQLDMYMLEHVCALLQAWGQKGYPLVPISVNFSRLHLQNPDLVLQIEAIAARYHVPRRFLEIELTESTIFDNEEVLTSLLNQLHAAGFTLSMDDFGTGYSSLGLLKNLPVDVIKIDQCFFGESTSAQRSRTVIESVIAMARRLGIQTVAEGVETEEHILLLRSIGCDIVQGYYYSRPLPADQFPAVSWPLLSLVE